MKHRHLSDLLPHKDDDPTEEQLIFLGRMLKDRFLSGVIILQIWSGEHHLTEKTPSIQLHRNRSINPIAIN